MSKEDVDAPVAIAHARLANRANAIFECRLTGATRTIAVALRIEAKNPTCSAHRHLPASTHLVHQLALAGQASDFSAHDILKHLIVERQVGHDPLQAVVLFLEFTHEFPSQTYDSWASRSIAGCTS
jgi:hypothetical protein